MKKLRKIRRINLKKLFIIIFILTSIVFLGNITHAEELPTAKTYTEQTGIDASAGSYELISPIGNLSKIQDVSDNGFSDFVNLLIRIAIALAGAIAVVMLIIGGIQYMGTDSVWEKGESRSRMTSAIIGLVLLLTSYFILFNINPDLVNIRIGGLRVSEEEWEKVEFDKGVRPWIGSTPVDISKASEKNIIQSNITTYDVSLKKAAVATGLSCTDLKAFAFVETGFDKDVVNGTKTSSSGAAGLMALMPATGKIYGCNTAAELSDPEKSALCGAKFLKELKTKACNGAEKNDVCNTTDTKYISAAYNGGPGVNAQSKDCPNEKVTRWQCHTNQGGLKETEYYTVKIAANQEQLKKKGWGCD